MSRDEPEEIPVWPTQPASTYRSRTMQPSSWCQLRTEYEPKAVRLLSFVFSVDDSIMVKRNRRDLSPSPFRRITLSDDCNLEELLDYIDAG